MSTNTAIEWTDATWNPVVGCTRISPGCKNCYAHQLHDMRHKAFKAGKKLPAQYAQPFTTLQTMDGRLDYPLHWKKPRRIFVNSVSDLFHESVPFEFIHAVWGTMRRTPQHTYQILTKRADRMLEVVSQIRAMEAMGYAKGFYSHVHLGVSVDNQTAADERVPLLLQVPAAVRFLSCEPLLGRVDICEHLGMWWNSTMQAFEGDGAMINRRGIEGLTHPGIGWVIAGGESGKGARPMHPDWARSLRDQCQAAGVPFFFKQWGEWFPGFDKDKDYSVEERGEGAKASTQKAQWLNLAGGQGFHGERVVGMRRTGKKAAGRLLDGREWNEFPKVAA